MKQGVLTTGRVRLLLSKGQSCIRNDKRLRDGERKRKSVRGCIVDANLAVVHLIVVKKGDADIPGLTDKTVPRRLGPKRASHIRKLFALTKDDDVRQYVVRRKVEGKDGACCARLIHRLHYRQACALPRAEDPASDHAGRAAAQASSRRAQAPSRRQGALVGRRVPQAGGADPQGARRGEGQATLVAPLDQRRQPQLDVVQVKNR